MSPATPFWLVRVFMVFFLFVFTLFLNVNEDKLRNLSTFNFSTFQLIGKGLLSGRSNQL